jgi:hypothetical protein
MIGCFMESIAGRLVIVKSLRQHNFPGAALWCRCSRESSLEQKCRRLLLLGGAQVKVLSYEINLAIAQMKHEAGRHLKRFPHKGEGGRISGRVLSNCSACNVLKTCPIFRCKHTHQCYLSARNHLPCLRERFTDLLLASYSLASGNQNPCYLLIHSLNERVHVWGGESLEAFLDECHVLLAKPVTRL